MENRQHTEWFETWFDSPYYHLLYKHRNCDEAELFIDNLVRHLKPTSKARFLDLACGKGRHSVFLNKKGFDVTGIDLSAQSIKWASQSENDHLHFYVHDMRKLFRTNYFDYVVNLFTSFGYFEKKQDDLSTINTAAKALKPNGIFILDFFNANKVISCIKLQDEIEVEGITFKLSKKLENDFIIKTITFSDKGKDYHFQEKVKALTLGDFENYFSANRLKIVHLWGDYQLNAFDIKNSDRLIIAAIKE